MSYDVRIKEVPTQYIVSVSARVSIAELSSFIQRSIAEMTEYLRQTGVAPSGPPLTLYHDQVNDDTDGDVEVCVPVERPLSGSGEIRAGELPAGPLAHTTCQVDYPEILSAYDAIAVWIRQHGHEFDGPPREIYISEHERRDRTGLSTEIAWPIR
ncbi:MAG: GyrI-like domain-containing protein [Chloroflexi bacterium]|nr:GyrI-like domain-containing protein [Chloroflexota bacterium]